VDTPVPKKGLRSGLRARGIDRFDVNKIRTLSAEDKKRAVIIVQDAFTSYFEPDVILSTIDVLRALGFLPFVAPFKANGKGLHVKGFLRAFRRVAGRNTRHLKGLEELGIPLVGLEPAVTLTYRDEYVAEGLGVQVQLLQEWLQRVLGEVDVSKLVSSGSFRLLAHCTERTAFPLAESAWQAVYGRFGLTLDPLSAGCCGMCGVFGHEAEHAEESRGIYDLSWRPLVEAESAQTLATGYSCRSQTERFSGTRLRHPMEALADLIAHQT